MNYSAETREKDIVFWGILSFLIIFGVFVLKSIAGFIFPLYYVYLTVSVLVFLLFYFLGFEIISVFYKQIYFGSILFLLIPVILGELTRGTLRWINLGPLTIQPSEIVKPFLLVSFSVFLYKGKNNWKKVLRIIIFLLIPLLLIAVQPSLGVSVTVFVGFFGIILAGDFDKKYIAYLLAFVFLSSFLIWFLLAPYQKSRIVAFLDPEKDPYGSGYNSLQSMIAVGSGEITGRGLGKGVQTQLSFLPERHTDFIFASISEELGFLGSSILLLGFFVLFGRILMFLKRADSPQSRSFVSGVFLTLLFQTFVHIGMNIGILPITGVTLPLISAGGSSLMSTMMCLGLVASCVRKESIFIGK